MTTHPIISIIGGGWSASQVDLAKLPGLIVCVNDAALLAPRCDVAISMDRLWTEGRFEWLKKRAGETWIRRAAVQNIPRPWPWLRVFECDHTSTRFDPMPRVFNGTNSGYCALSYAYSLAPARVVLVGYDMQIGPKGEKHWFPDYPWKDGGGTGPKKLSDWARQLDHAAKQFKAAGIEVFNVSRRSAVKSFMRIDPGDICAISR